MMTTWSRSEILSRVREAGAVLDGDIGGVKRVLADWPELPGDPAGLLEAAGTIGAFRHNLMCHFALEELGGFLDEAARESPEQDGEVRRLKEDHEYLREEVGRLHHDTIAAAYGATLDLRLLRRHIVELLEAIRDHEARERALLQGLEGFKED